MALVHTEHIVALLFAVLGLMATGGEAIDCYSGDFCTGRTFEVSSSQECCLGVGSSYTKVAGSGKCSKCGADVTIGFGLPSLTVAESDGQFTMCVVKSGSTISWPVSVDITVTDLTTMAGLDYRLSTIPETVTIGPTEERVCFTGIIINDVLGLEGDEDFRLTLVDPTPGSVAIGQETTTITIRDDDVVTVRFLQSAYTVLRSDDSVTVCLTKDLATSITVAVRIFTEDGTATDGLDYIGGSFIATLSSSAAAVTCQNITVLGISLQETEFFVRIYSTPKGVIVGEPSSAAITIALADNRFECMTDSVLGDPLYTTALMFGPDVPHMCYEVHGKPSEYFNLITSKCVIVNARYKDIGPNRNIIDQIAIRAAYVCELTSPIVSGCQEITVDLKGCSPTPESIPLGKSGITVERLDKPERPRVIVKVPNCDGDKPLEMHIICERKPDPMIRFEVLRGVIGGHPDTHGLLGQFWNNPAGLFPGVQQIPSCNSNDLFTIEFGTRGKKGTPPLGKREFTGCLRPITWSGDPGICLYVGDRQAGSRGDSVIEGNYKEYIVQQFGDLEPYPRFDESLC